MLRGAPDEQVQTLQELTNGGFRMAGNAIVNAESNRIVGNISRSGGAIISRGTRGTVFLNNIVDRNVLSQASRRGATARAIVQGDLSLLGVQASEDVNRMITLAPHGSVLYVNESIPSGKGRYTAIDAGVFGEIGPPMTNEFGRLATPNDLLTRGVAGWLSRNAPAALDRLKQSGVTLPDGTTTVNGSDIVRAIAANISVTPILTYLLKSGV